MFSTDLNERLTRLIFSGEFETGCSLVERDLADRLGVSRIPVREALSQLVAHGTLQGGRKREGVRIRRYSADEIRQLYDYRMMIEAGVARSAAVSALESDILRLTLISEEMESVFDEDDTTRWGMLDRQFHEGLAEACRNDRFERAIKNLLRESYYVFYVVARQRSNRELTVEERASHKREVLNDHRALIERIQARDADGAEARARLHIGRSAESVIRAVIEADLGGRKA